MEEEEEVVVVVDGGTRGHGKPSILLSLSCVCLQRTSIEGGWRGTRVQDLGSRKGGKDPERRDRNRKVPRVDARSAGRGERGGRNESKWWRRSRMRGEQKKGFENSRGEESSGWVVE